MSQVKIKFCGITNTDDAELAVSLDVWAVGINLWEHSSRAVTLDQAAEIGAALKRRAEVVGVFVNPTLEEVTAAADIAGLTILQMHGDEGPVFCAEAARRTGCKIIKAARVRENADIQAVHAFRTDFHLLDSYVKGVPGGTGETFDWELLRRQRSKVPMILSGGLTPENVAEAIRIVEPFAVDVASGIEEHGNPRRKDPERMAAFVAAVNPVVADEDLPIVAAEDLPIVAAEDLPMVADEA
jgi:phosphoribosylanthranilate isomerase